MQKKKTSDIHGKKSYSVLCTIYKTTIRKVTQVDIYQKLAFLWVHSADSCVNKCQPLCNISQYLILAVYPVLSVPGNCWAHAETLGILWGGNIPFVRTHSKSFCAKRKIPAEKQNNNWTFYIILRFRILEAARHETIQY